MAINLAWLKKLTGIRLHWVILGLTILGSGYIGWQLWQHGLDRPISEDTIRKQQLRLSAEDLQRLQTDLGAYRTVPASATPLSSDPFSTSKTSTTPAP